MFSKLKNVKKTWVKPSLPLVLFFCFMLYTPILAQYPQILNVLSLVISFAVLFINRKIAIKLVNRRFAIPILAIFLYAMSLLTIYMHGTNDFSYLTVTTYFFRKIIIFLSLLCLVIKKHGEKEASNYFMLYFIMTHLFYVIATILLVTVPQAQEIWFSVFSRGGTPEWLFNIRSYTFRIGWQGFAGFRMTLYCSISAIFSLFLRYGTRYQKLNNIQFAILFLSAVVGNMFYGRVGLFATIVISVFAIVYWNRKRIKNLLKFFVVICLFVLAIASLKNIPFLQNWYQWMSSPIINFVETGSFADDSFDRLQEMNDIEVPYETLLFGDGYYMKDGLYYMETDSGLYRSVFFWGVTGTIIAYCVTIYSIIGLRKMSGIIMIQLLVVFAMFEYKGAVYYEFIPISYILYIAWKNSVLIEIRSKDENEKNV